MNFIVFFLVVRNCSLETYRLDGRISGISSRYHACRRKHKKGDLPENMNEKAIGYTESDCTLSLVMRSSNDTGCVGL